MMHIIRVNVIRGVIIGLALGTLLALARHACAAPPVPSDKSVPMPLIRFEAAEPSCDVKAPEVFKVVKSFVGEQDRGLATLWLETATGYVQVANIGLSRLSEADRSWLPTMFWPGKRVRIRYEECGRAMIVLDATSDAPGSGDEYVRNAWNELEARARARRAPAEPAPVTQQAAAAPPPVDIAAIEKRAREQGRAEAIAALPGVTRW